MQPTSFRVMAECRLRGASALPEAHGDPSLVSYTYLKICMQAAGYLLAWDKKWCPEPADLTKADLTNPGCFRRADNSN